MRRSYPSSALVLQLPRSSNSMDLLYLRDTVLYLVMCVLHPRRRQHSSQQSTSPL